jgi:hypothetical protein
MLKSFAFICWISLFAFTIHLATRDDLFSQELQGEIIAKIIEHNGTVQVRSQDLALWSYVKQKQGLTNGSILATSSNSIASIEFLGGRKISVAPNSQIVISIGEQGPKELSLTLLKGTIKTVKSPVNTALRNPKKSVKNIRINVGKASVVSAKSSDIIAFKKLVSQPTALIEVKKGKVSLTKGSINVVDSGAGTIQKITTPKKAPNVTAKTVSTIAAPKIEPKELSKLKFKSKSNSLITKNFNTVDFPIIEDTTKAAPIESIKVATLSLSSKDALYWDETKTKVESPGDLFTGSLRRTRTIPQVKEAKIDRNKTSKNTLEADTLLALSSSALLKPAERQYPVSILTKSRSYWTKESISRGRAPGFSISLGTAKTPPGEKDFHYLGLRSKKLRISKKIATKGGSMTLSAGSLKSIPHGSLGVSNLALNTGIGKNKSMNPKSYKLLSLADYPNSTSTLYLKQFTKKKTIKKWYKTKSTTISNAKIAIELAKDVNLSTMSDYINGSQGFLIKSGQMNYQSPSNVSYIFDRNSLLAAVKTRSAKDLDTYSKNVSEALKGSSIINTTPGTLLVSINKAQNKLPIQTIKATNQKRIFVLSGNRLIQIDKNLLLSNPLARQIILQNGKAIFDKKVSISSGS